MMMGALNNVCCSLKGAEPIKGEALAELASQYSLYEFIMMLLPRVIDRAAPSAIMA